MTKRPPTDPSLDGETEEETVVGAAESRPVRPRVAVPVPRTATRTTSAVKIPEREAKKADESEGWGLPDEVEPAALEEFKPQAKRAPAGPALPRTRTANQVPAPKRVVPVVKVPSASTSATGSGGLPKTLIPASPDTEPMPRVDLPKAPSAAAPPPVPRSRDASAFRPSRSSAWSSRAIRSRGTSSIRDVRDADAATEPAASWSPRPSRPCGGACGRIRASLAHGPMERVELATDRRWRGAREPKGASSLPRPWSAWTLATRAVGGGGAREAEGRRASLARDGADGARRARDRAVGGGGAPGVSVAREDDAPHHALRVATVADERPEPCRAACADSTSPPPVGGGEPHNGSGPDAVEAERSRRGSTNPPPSVARRRRARRERLGAVPR